MGQAVKQCEYLYSAYRIKEGCRFVKKYYRAFLDYSFGNHGLLTFTVREIGCIIFGFVAYSRKVQGIVYDFFVVGRQAAEEYKGARLEYPQQHIFSLIDSVKGKGAVNEKEKNRIYDAVIQEAKARGKSLTDNEIKAIIFKQDVEGYVAGSETGWFGRRPSMTYGEALRKSGGSMGLFRPDVPEDTATQIKVRLEMEKPWMTLLTEDMRNALVQTVYLQEQFGIPLELSAEEREAFQNAIDAYNKRTNR